MQRAANEIQELIPKTRHNSFQFTGGVLFVQGCCWTKLGFTDNSYSEKGGIVVFLFTGGEWINCPSSGLYD